MNNVLKNMPMIVMALLVGLAALFPEVAFAQSSGAAAKVADAGSKSYDLIFSFAYWACAIAVIVCGGAAMFGRMEWTRFGQVVLGITIIFCSTGIVDYFK